MRDNLLNSEPFPSPECLLFSDPILALQVDQTSGVRPVVRYGRYGRYGRYVTFQLA